MSDDQQPGICSCGAQHKAQLWASPPASHASTSLLTVVLPGSDRRHLHPQLGTLVHQALESRRRVSWRKSVKQKSC